MDKTTSKTVDLVSMTREELEAYAMQVSSEKEELLQRFRGMKSSINWDELSALVPPASRRLLIN